MAFLFGSKAQRTFKKIQDLASSNMVDQAAVMIEEDLDLLLSDHDVSAKLVPFLMDIGHPDLGGRIGEKIMRTHSDLRMSISRLLEEKQGQFPRSIELLRVIWRSRLHQRDFNGLIELLGSAERVTVNRFSDSVQSALRTLDGVTGRELGSGIDRVLAWSVITLQKGDPGAAMDVLVDAADRCRFPEESLARLSGWIAARTGGTDMDVNLKRIRVLTAIGDNERAILELPSLYDADSDIVKSAISLVEKELIPVDKTPRAKISLARLISESGKSDEACLILDGLIDESSNLSILEQAVTNLVINASGCARVHLLQARLRLTRGEHTQALDSVDKAFQCDDVADSPIVDICKTFIDSGVDREGLVTGKLGEFLVKKGSVEDAVEILCLSAQRSPEWVLEQIQKLLQRDKTSAAILTLLAVVLLIDNRGSEAAATLKHLSAREDVKSRQDIVSVLSHFDALMGTHHELRRLRASAGYFESSGSNSAEDWFELLLVDEKIKDSGLLEIFDRGILQTRGEEVFASDFAPNSPTGELILAAAGAFSGNLEDTSEHLSVALTDKRLIDRVTNLVSSLPFSVISSMKPAKLFIALNKHGRGGVVEKLLPLLASTGSEQWMDELASRILLDSDIDTILFRIAYFIEQAKPGTAASSVQEFNTSEEDISNLINGCAFLAAGNIEKATVSLSSAADSGRTAYLAKEVLSEYVKAGKASPGIAIALAQAQLVTNDSDAVAHTLKDILNESVVKEFLETAILSATNSSELHASLALARIYAGDPEGYRTAAGTAIEGKPELATILVEAGLSYSLEYNYAAGLVFVARLGKKYITDYNATSILLKALCLQPDLWQQISLFEVDDLALKMLLSLVTLEADGFRYVELPSEIKLPDVFIEKAFNSWKEAGKTESLEQLEQLADETGHSVHAHAIRVVLAEAGVDRSQALLDDTFVNTEFRLDFLKLCSTKDLATKGLLQLFPNGATGYGQNEVLEAVNMLIRCKATEKLFDFAIDILKDDSSDNKKAAERIVDIFMPTANEPGSLTITQIVDLLLITGRLSEAFNFARGDSDLLLKVKNKVAFQDSTSTSSSAHLREGRVFQILLSNDIESDPMSMGQALWLSGKRVTACRVWREAYARTENPIYLKRLEYALGCMGSASEVDAVIRLLSEKHPEFSMGINQSVQRNSSLKMISYNIQKWRK